MWSTHWVDVLGAVDKLLPILESLVGDEIVVRFGFTPTLAPWPLATATLCAGNLFLPHDPRASWWRWRPGSKRAAAPQWPKCVRAQPLRPQPARRRRRRLHQTGIREDRVHRRLLAQDQCERGLLGHPLHRRAVVCGGAALPDPARRLLRPTSLTVDEHGIDASSASPCPISRWA